MIGKKGESMITQNAPADMKAVLGKGSEFEGKLKFEGTVRIDGQFKGEIISAGTLIIGDNAKINGNIEVDSTVMSGEMHGNIKAKSRVELRAPGKLFGDLQTPVLIIEEGVIFNGNCQMSKDGKPATEAKPAAAEAKPATNDHQPKP